MAATLQDVESWKTTARKMGAVKIISVCDTFDWEDYPVYVMPNDDLEEIKKPYDNTNMQKINEIININ